MKKKNAKTNTIICVIVALLLLLPVGVTAMPGSVQDDVKPKPMVAVNNIEGLLLIDFVADSLESDLIAGEDDEVITSFWTNPKYATSNVGADEVDWRKELLAMLADGFDTDTLKCDFYVFSYSEDVFFVWRRGDDYVAEDIHG